MIFSLCFILSMILFFLSYFYFLMFSEQNQKSIDLCLGGWRILHWWINIWFLFKLMINMMVSNWILFDLKMGFFFRVLFFNGSPPLFFFSFFFCWRCTLFIEVFHGPKSKSALSLRAFLNLILDFQFARFDPALTVKSSICSILPL